MHTPIWLKFGALVWYLKKNISTTFGANSYKILEGIVD